jgi:hypothetical protein
MGAHEFARQYEWSTWKSQPNCLKRTDEEDSAYRGVDSRRFPGRTGTFAFFAHESGGFQVNRSGL